MPKKFSNPSMKLTSASLIPTSELGTIIIGTKFSLVRKAKMTLIYWKPVSAVYLSKNTWMDNSTVSMMKRKVFISFIVTFLKKLKVKNKRPMIRGIMMWIIIVTRDSVIVILILIRSMSFMLNGRILLLIKTLLGLTSN